MMRSKNVLVLLSGGIDSSALIYYYKSLSFTVKAMFVDYGQPAAIAEKVSAVKISEYYDVELLTIQLGFSIKLIGFEYSMRNALLINTALSYETDSYNLLALGIHSGTSYYDCSEEFINCYQRIIDGHFSGKVNLDAPFINLDKAEVYKYAKSINLPVNYTFSCENSSNIACNVCPSCKDRVRY